MTISLWTRLEGEAGIEPAMSEDKAFTAPIVTLTVLARASSGRL